MNLVFYQPTSNGPGEKLRNVIETLVPDGQAEIYTTIDSLSSRFRRPYDHVDLAVLLALNAAVEAARAGEAGEAGAGFAVVAFGSSPCLYQPEFKLRGITRN